LAKVTHKEITDWLLSGDVAIQYQVYRDLFDTNKRDLQKRIAREGWGYQYLSRQTSKGHWGRSYYQPKWISTHYTLLDLKNLAIDPQNAAIRKAINMILDVQKSADGGINPSPNISQSDVCVNGMFLNFAAYFNMDESKLKSIVDFILLQILADGGFNCHYNRIGAKHSSLHSTLSVLEGILEYRNNGYTYKLPELQNAGKSAMEFILKHQLFISDRTGEIIKPSFLKLSWPARWYYDILKALDYMQFAHTPYDTRMQPAIDYLISKRKKNNQWMLQAHHPGQMHFIMEKAGQASRWNTLRSLRVLKYYNKELSYL
jgi:Prenyltransferase and squalene oxidase repeat